MMLLLLIIAVVSELTATTANGFLDECGFDESLRIEDDLVADVLHTFYDDLVFVQAATQVRLPRDYGQVLGELRGLFKSQELMQQMEKVTELLGKLGHFKQALDRCNRDVYPLLDPDAQEGIAIKSYLYYLKAEAYRLMGDPDQASEQISEATVRRQDSEGVSINDLERSNGMIELARVSKYNQEVDKLYGLNKGPNFRLLRIVHSRSRGDTAPLKTRKTIEADRGPTMKTVTHRYGYFRVLDDKPTPVSSESVYMRVNPEQDDFSGQSVAEVSAKGILCEFAQKLIILGVMSKANYTTIVDEIRQIDSGFADKINERVIKSLDSGNHNEALLAVNKYKQWMSPSSPGNSNEGASSSTSSSSSSSSSSPRERHWQERALETYADYFKAEIYRRTKKSCIFLKEIGQLRARLKKFRQSRTGVSVGKILELDGKAILLSMKCFHKTIRSVYELVGDESETELEIKRSGGREKILSFIKLDR